MRRIDTHLLKTRLATISFGKLIIIRVISIYNLEKSVAEKVLDSFRSLDKSFYKEVSEDGKTMIFEKWVLDTEFFNLRFLNQLTDVIDINCRLIFIFDNMPLSIIKLRFFSLGYSISGGDNTLKHVLSPKDILLYDFLRYLFEEDISKKIVNNSFKLITNKREISAMLFNSWVNRDQKLFDIIKASYEHVEGTPICDSRVMNIIRAFTENKRTRRDNISIRDLSIKDITDTVYDRKYNYYGERNRPFVYKKKIKKYNNFLFDRFTGKYYHTSSKFLEENLFSSTESDVDGMVPKIIKRSTDIKSKRRIFSLWMDYDMVMDDNFLKSFNYFCNQIFSHKDFRFRVIYGIVVKIKISSRQYYTLFKSLRTLCVKDTEDLNYLDTLYGDVYIRVDEILKEPYPELIDEYPEGIVIDFFEFTTLTNEVEYNNYINNISQLSVIKDYQRIKSVKKDFNFFGGYLSGIRIIQGFKTNIFEGKLVSNLHWNNDKTMLEGLPCEIFVEFDHKRFLKWISPIDKSDGDFSNFRGYVKKIRGRWYLIIIYITKTVGGVLLKRKAFNCLGELVSQVSDIFVKDHSTFFDHNKEWREELPNLSLYKDMLNAFLIRTSGDMIQILDNNDNLIYMLKIYNFKPIGINNKNFLKETYFLPDLSFGTLDLETYNADDDNESYVYSLGFYIAQENVLETFYIDKDLDSSKLVHTCFDKLLTSTYAKRRFYIHNLGGFDAYFIIKNLALYNSEVLVPLNENIYYFNNLNRDDKFIKLVVKRVINGKVRSVTLCDSFAYLSNSLDSLGKSYDLSIRKGEFPHEFVRKNTLFYKGITPIDYFKHNKDDIKLKQDWDLKEECLKYLELDLKSLHQVLSIVARNFHKLFDEQITNSLTISGLSMKIFMKDHYNEKKPLPLIKNKKVFADIHKAYYGGRTEVHKPYGKNLYYYDINSLYPFASLNTFPGTKAKYIDFVKPLKGIQDDMFGYFYCKINTSKSIIKDIGLLPRRDEKGGLTYPLGEWYGEYFSEELKFVKKYGYEIEIYYGYIFDKVDNVFDSFIYKLSDLKANAKDKNEREVTKLVMNSHLGRFGMDPFKETSDLLTKDELLRILARYKTSKHIKITDDLYYVSYINTIDKDICTLSGENYIKELNLANVTENRGTKSSIDFESISTAAAILSYARIYMLNAMLYVIYNNGRIYYTDTDSLVIDIKLPEAWIDPKKLGLFKLELEVEEGYFLAEKVYVLIPKNWDGKESSLIKKAKGILSDKLTLMDYINMYDQGRFDGGTNVSSRKNLGSGNVIIKTNTNVRLSLDYKKRYKVFSNGKWIDTSPIVLDGHSHHSLIDRKSVV